MAQDNTSKNIETVGIIGGREVDGKLLASLLILPP
jgi:hypothetical protein